MTTAVAGGVQVVYGTFSIFESVMSFLKDIIPYYNVLKLGLFIFLYHSSTKGATKVTHVLPCPALFVPSTWKLGM